MFDVGLTIFTLKKNALAIWCIKRKKENTKLSNSERSQHPRARNDYDEEAAYESYMNPEPGLQSGPGDSANAD